MKISEELEDKIGEAIETAMGRHEPLKNDSVCTCRFRNNMDGDVLFAHRISVVREAVITVIESAS